MNTGRVPVSNKTRILKVLVGAAAVASLTYVVTRRGQQRRAGEVQAANDTAVPPGELSEAQGAAGRGWEAFANEWQGEDVNPTRGSVPDPLDVALNLEGIFDAEYESTPELTVRPDLHLPRPLGGDDEDAPGADDLGRAWLSQATLAERSLRVSDLVPELDDIAASAGDDDRAGDDEEDEEDEEEERA